MAISSLKRPPRTKDRPDRQRATGREDREENDAEPPDGIPIDGSNSFQSA